MNGGQNVHVEKIHVLFLVGLSEGVRLPRKGLTSGELPGKSRELPGKSGNFRGTLMP